MVPAPFRVVLDANVLFPFTVRDTLLRAAALGMYQVHWSEESLGEATRLKDFHPMPDGVEAQSPDDFLLDLLDLAPTDMVELIRRQATALNRPPVTLDDLLTGLGKTVPRFEAAVRALVDSGDEEG